MHILSIVSIAAIAINLIWIFSSGIINHRDPTPMPTSAIVPTPKPTTVLPTSSPTLSPAPSTCTTYMEGNNGVPVQVAYAPTPGTFGDLTFNRPVDVFGGIVSFNYLNGQVKFFFDILLNFPPNRPTEAQFRMSTSSSVNSSFPIVIPIPPGVQEFESDWIDPDGCTPLPCTQTLFIFGRIPYCPIITQAPSKTPTTEYEAGRPTLSPTISE